MSESPEAAAAAHPSADREPVAAQPRGPLSEPQPVSRDSEDAAADPESVARSICLRLLAGAPKTRAQLAGALRGKNVSDQVAERVLDRLGEVGLVDDAAFAAAWVQSRHAGKGLARRTLKSELRQRGVAADVADEALETIGDADEVAAARSLVARKLPSTRRLQPSARYRRLVGILARKGYSAALAAEVVREALQADVMRLLFGRRAAKRFLREHARKTKA